MMSTVIAFPRLRDTCPEDLLWQSPGAPVTRNHLAAEEVEVAKPEQWRAIPTTGGTGWAFIGFLLLAAFLAGFICGGYTVLYSLIGRL